MTPTIEQHKVFASKINEMEDNIRSISLEILNAYGKSSKAYRHTKKIIAALQDFKSEMDNRLINENGRNNACNSLLEVYYKFAPKTK